jgi:hypothetical protein
LLFMWFHSQSPIFISCLSNSVFFVRSKILWWIIDEKKDTVNIYPCWK